MLPHWPKDDDGKAVVFPMVAFEALVPHGALCALLVHFLANPEALVTDKPSSLPLVMTPHMARSVAAALIRVADEAERGPTAEMSN